MFGERPLAECSSRSVEKVPPTALGRELSLAIGCFREAQIQGLLFGDEPWKAASMSRPNADSEGLDKQSLAGACFTVGG
jgi:hypothetical protein